MPTSRLFAVGVLAVALALPLAVPPRAQAAVMPLKVALIVGPMGADTPGNRSHADAIAADATALGATVTKAYSPNATYAQVRAAVAGANIVVYFGHGNGYPNPYLSQFMPDRNDGWGLNTTTTHGDGDSWSAGSLVYCGEKALEGKLTSTDGVAQRTYCAGGAIAPAPGFVMVYIGSCYTAGGNEPQLAQATNVEARAHLAYFSRPVLTALGGSGYFAGHAQGVVDDLLAQPDRSYGDIFNDNLSSHEVVSGPYDTPHALVADAREWLTKQSSTPYWDYAFAGDPGRTFAGGTATYTPADPTLDFVTPRIRTRTPGPGATGVTTTPRVTITFTDPMTYVTNTNITLWRGSTQLAAYVSYNSTTFTAALAPKYTLARGTTYTIKVNSHVRDAAGNHIAPTSWSFTTRH